MASVLGALFGHHKDKNNDKQNEKAETANDKHHEKVETTAKSASSSSGSTVAHTAVTDDVRVHSVVESETNTNVSIQNSKKIADLMSKLGTTHNQIDEYSRKRTAEISEAVAKSIQEVVSDTAAQQQNLLADANERSAAIEIDYKHRLQQYVQQLDTEKAVLLAELERKLNERQEAILLKAKQDIDAVQNAANAEKMAILKEAQSRASQQIDHITGKVAELAAEDAQRRLQSTTQTIIKTQAVASGETHSGAAHHSSTSSTKSTESHHSSSSSSKSSEHHRSSQV